ncbi:HNH endonuclease signature motif containing protein [Microbacterium sp. UFMG61]|uniref:HNH endonuclease signature motif containing protein n=1 Tax=Microbacterium sp. UFMG61 TaxID=2745935 RepID=UPI0018907787|nr:HNH endonuclease signature motif containing protein [Microbacterium sp. UFMG61]
MSKLVGLHEAMSRLDEVWADSSSASGLSREQLLAMNTAIDAMKRQLDAVHIDVAARIASESRAELGAGGLAKQQGYRSAARLISSTTGISFAEASRVIRVGEATAPRADLLGSPLPARYPLVRAALLCGRLSVQAAALILALLERCRVAVGTQKVAEAEKTLVDAAVDLPLDDVRTIVDRAEGWLDPDGSAPRDEERRSRRSLTIFERDGMVHLNGRFHPEAAAPLVAAIRGYVTAAFAARKDEPAAESPDADRRSVAMLQADALALFCAHVLGCRDERMPLAGATVVVRVTLDDLQSGCGTAEIDGIGQKISIGAARRMAASGGIIPCVLGGDSQILDWGREKRLFTKAQRLALVERDGGCAMCGLPPEMTKAHHIRWWSRDAGSTDLSNGLLLCETCHHRIHDNGWEIRIDGVGVAAKVWFLPPAYVDAERRPRLGGRARFDVAA